MFIGFCPEWPSGPVCAGRGFWARRSGFIQWGGTARRWGITRIKVGATCRFGLTGASDWRKSLKLSGTWVKLNFASSEEASRISQVRHSFWPCFWRGSRLSTAPIKKTPPCSSDTSVLHPRYRPNNFRWRRCSWGTRFCSGARRAGRVPKTLHSRSFSFVRRWARFRTAQSIGRW